MPNSRNLTFFKVVWHEKMLFGKFLVFFSGLGRNKNVVWHSLKTSLLELKLLDYFQALWHLLMLFSMF